MLATVTQRDIENIEAELAHEADGHEIARLPAAGVAAMDLRLEYLRRRLHELHPDCSDEAKQHLQDQIATAEQMRTEYQQLLAARN
jgi:hypothetical protein